MLKTWASLIILSSFLGLVPAFAEDGELNSASQEALEQTKTLLNDRTAREKAAQENTNAQKADQSVKSLGLSQQGNDEVYKLSGQILENMVKDTNGDPAALTLKAQELMKNPESMEQLLTPDQREKIRKLAGEKENADGPPKTSQ